jgi:hypothetical protein
MIESFSFQRFLNLFNWQMKKMKPFAFISIAIALFVYSYIKTWRHNTNLDSFSEKLPLFIFVIAICTNFFKQLIKNETAGGFILLPASYSEKFIFLLTSTVFIPMVLIISVINGADILARLFHEIPDNYSFMNINSYLTLLLISSVAFFTHCLPRKSWTLGLSLIFVSFLIPMVISYYKRKEVLIPVISDIWLTVNQVAYLPVISGIVILGAYVFFKRNEISNFKIYE